MTGTTINDAIDAASGVDTLRPDGDRRVEVRLADYRPNAKEVA